MDVFSYLYNLSLLFGNSFKSYCSLDREETISIMHVQSMFFPGKGEFFLKYLLPVSTILLCYLYREETISIISMYKLLQRILMKLRDNHFLKIYTCNDFHGKTKT